MRSYINLFLTLVMPVSILLTAVATVYYAMNYEFTKAVKLGILAGVMSGVTFSLILSFIIVTIRFIRLLAIKPKTTSKIQKHQQTYTKPDTDLKSESGTIEKQIMLLMNRELAYEVALNAVDQKKIGNVIHQNKNEGTILLRNKNQETNIRVAPLTKHTSKVYITSTADNTTIKNIITALKEKEHSFMQY